MRWLCRQVVMQRLLGFCVTRLVMPEVVTPSNGAVALQAGGATTSAPSDSLGWPEDSVGPVARPQRPRDGSLQADSPPEIPRKALDRLHFASAGAVGFARGMNDTPKVVALLVAAQILEIPLVLALLLAGVAMAVGGIRHSRRVSATMSEGITTMNHAQGLAANLTTAFLVIFASRWGVPVSTTHVSCGSIIGVGTLSGGARWNTIRTIFASWLGTLPLAALLAWLSYACIH